jgi:hypothetical protein
MRTKTLLIAAAALVAGIVSSNAQPVFSQNVVGYVNISIPANQLTLVANPLDDGTNTATSLGGALPNKSTIQTWNGSGYNASSKGGGVWTVNFALPPGVGFFVKSPTALTNTFVGNVVTQVGGNATNALPAGALVLLGSITPYTGDLTDTNLDLGPTLANKSTVQVWNGTGFTASSKGGGSFNTPLTLSVGQGFFVKSATTTNWVQTLPAQ